MLEEKKKKGLWENTEIDMCGDDVCFNGLTNEYPTKILSFGEDDDGWCFKCVPLDTKFLAEKYDCPHPKHLWY